MVVKKLTAKSHYLYFKTLFANGAELGKMGLLPLRRRTENNILLLFKISKVRARVDQGLAFKYLFIVYFGVDTVDTI